MGFFLFRVLVLLWNNSPSWLQKLLKATGLPQSVVDDWMPFRCLPIPPTEQGVRQLIESIVQPGWVCADVGANYGMMTEVMAVQAGTAGRTYAFEAHPFNAGILRRRMKALNLDQLVEIVNQAVSDGTETRLKLFPGRRHSPNEWNIVGHDVTGRSTKAAMEIPAVSLDRFFGDKPLHFVKIDVEGAEVKVLPGARELLRRQRPVLIIEFHSDDAWRARTELFGADYRLFGVSGKGIGAPDRGSHDVVLWPPCSKPKAHWLAHQHPA